MEANKEANRALWDELAITDPNFTKRFKRPGGFSGTAIAPMYSVQKMTSMFGPAGTGWGLDLIEDKIVEVFNAPPVVFIKAQVWYLSGGEIHHTPPAWGGEQLVRIKRDGTVTTDDEAFKKASTDAMTKCFSFLGIGADVHLGMFDKNGYQDWATGHLAANAEAEKAAKQAVRNDVVKAAVERARASDQPAPGPQQQAEPDQPQPADESCPLPVLQRIEQCDANDLNKAAEWVEKTLVGKQLESALDAIKAREIAHTS